MAEQHEKALVPQIRFAGFTDPWEQRKLEDYVVVSTAKNVDGRFNKEDVLSVSGEYGIVNQIAFQGRSFAGSSVLNYGIVNTGDIVYTKSPLNSNPYGIIKVNKGIPGIVSTLYAVYRPQDNVHTNFIQVYFEQHERMNNYMHPLVNKGAKNDMKVTAENALKGVVTFPSREEQVIISEFFDRLDSLITLHQRKYDKLCVLKKTMLDKMFPKGGSLYPEIRFAGFTDPWEQRKLEDYVVVSTAKNVDGRFNKEDVLSVSGEYGIVNQIAFQGRSFAGSSVLNYGIVNTGDIVYTKSPLNSNPYGIIKVNKGIPGIVSTLYAVYRPQDNVHTNFIQVYFEQHERMNNYMHPLVNKGAKNDMKVTAENALKGVVTFPSREEQVIISEFFDRLDSLITLHQRKLELLRNIKKSMLDKMFV
ncbi:restriction endonuclease subunit S [Bifidobacterium adolescentis]|uniref:restriction endonuclease subunit S n=2 Tax=Bifidobacterium adolescentis TaxID=1680 RepID=UPI003BB59AB6